MEKTKEKLAIAVVGHVDHGKSTMLGRLLADTQSLPEGKLEGIIDECKRTSKTFEYAFLLDALKDERSQGITIDSARCPFKTDKREYLFIDAPGHIDFLKNMVSGSARADAAILVIDASEGIQENSRRHGYFLSMLGIKQIAVCINKMDIVGYNQKKFEQIKKDYSEFLDKISLKAKIFIPISSREGENVSKKSEKLAWHKGPSVLETIDSFENITEQSNNIFRMPVQDVYRFTDQGDTRRLIAGRIETGKISVGDDIVFLPSNKQSRIKTIETFNSPSKKEISAGHSTSFTLEKEVYVTPGEIMCRKKEKKLPHTGTMFKAMIFWMGENSLVPGKEYKLKLATSKVFAKISMINRTMNASTLTNKTKNHLDQYEVGECIIELAKPIAFDAVTDFQATSRFVLVDNFEISGGGIIIEPIINGTKNLEKKVDLREIKWEHSEISASDRLNKYKAGPRLILITGEKGIDKVSIGKKLERILSDKNLPVYYVGIRNIIYGVDADIQSIVKYRDEHIRRLSEVLHILLDAGLTAIATASDLNENDIDNIRTILKGQKITTVIVGHNYLVEDKAEIRIKETRPSEKVAELIYNKLDLKD